jgi:hypothetical protein
VRYVGLLLYQGLSVEDCSLFLTANPHPRYEGPSTWGMEPISECSGPFRIVPTYFEGDTEQSWCVVGEHDTEFVGRCIPLPYGCMTNEQLLEGYGLRVAISAAIRQHIGVTAEEREDECLAEIGRLIRLEDSYEVADAAEYGKTT